MLSHVDALVPADHMTMTHYVQAAIAEKRSVGNAESKLLMLSHAFDRWGVLRMTLKTDSRNARSRRAIERIAGPL